MARAEVLAVGAVLALAGCTPRQPAAPPPVVLVSIDTLRADHLPAYGYAGIATPALDALRRDAVLFENAYTHCPLTLPAHASLLTGLLPPRHGVRSNLGYRLDPSHLTLAQALRARGYATGGFVSSYVLRAATGIGSGFERYDEVPAARPAATALSELQRPGRETVAQATAWLAGAGPRPVFLFVHLYEPHSPYAPPAPFATRYGATYDGEIATADAALGTLIAALKADGLYDRALVIVVSDHGEGLAEHGEEEHGILLYRETLHVPLLLKLPEAARAGESVEAPVGLDAVWPTVAASVGLSLPPGVEARSLLEPQPDAAIYAETYYPRLHLGWSELRSLVDARRHYIEGPRPELYDVGRDPRESADIASAEASTAARYRARLLGIEPQLAPAAQPSDEDRERLAALGYVGATPVVMPGAALPNPRERLGSRQAMKAALALARSGDDRAAAAALRALLLREAGFFDARVELAAALGRLERPAEALAEYRAAAALSPPLAGSLAVAMARLALETGAFDEADRLVDAARRAAGSDETRLAEADVVAAESLLRRGRPQDALAFLDARAARGVRVAGLEFVRGDALARLGRTAEARSALAAEVQLFPENLRAWSSLALVTALETREPAAADAVLQSMYRANPRPASAALAARTLRFMGDAAAAAAWNGRLH